MNLQKLTDQQRKGLCDVLYWAFIELRGMDSPERAHQASKLAYALHNLPHLVFAEKLDWDQIEGGLRYYQNRFYQHDATRGYDYLLMIEQVRKGEPVKP